MAHLSLYRKHRPQRFSEVVGQQHVTQTLKTALKQDRLAHALLFSGPRGTGKTSTARILARALNCETPGEEPCGTCASCLQIAAGVSLDVVEIDAASHGSVDDARELRERVAYSSVEGRWKVYILDECHMLSTAANNALLKVLEEPPKHVIFVFATTEPHKVLQTVLDRCQRYEFRSVNATDTALRLVQVCEEEGISADDETIQMISRRAGGSVRDALSLLDQLRSYAGDRIEVGDLAQLLGRLPDDVLFEAVDLISERDIGAVFMFADRLVKSGVDVREFARGLTDHLRSLFLVLHAPAAREILEVSDDQLTRLQEQANRFESAEVLRLIDLTNETQLQLRQAVQSRLALEVGLARMTRPDLHATPSTLLARLERLEKRSAASGELETFIEPAPAPAPPATPRVAPKLTIPQPAAPRPTAPPAPAAAAAPRPAPPASTPAPVAASSEQAPPSAAPAVQSKSIAASPPPPAVPAEKAVEVPADPAELDIERITRAWPLILDKVRRRKISSHAMLLPATPVGWSDGELVLEFEYRSSFHRDEMKKSTQSAPLVEAFNEILGVSPRLRCVLGQEPAKSGKKAPEPDMSIPSPEDLAEDGNGEPPPDAIEMIKRAFNAKVISEEGRNV